MKKTIPAVSIIIPMYNTEKYVGECLDSILAQTFTDYEVIVVDDCSTDNSCSIVESYMPKFTRGGGRLQLIHTKVNSGGCAVPRNIAIGFAQGEYLMFVDSDDAITKTAVAELYDIAKKMDADVVGCDGWYSVKDDEFINALNINSLKPSYLNKDKKVTKPTLLIDDIEKRSLAFQQREFIWHFAGKLVRRNVVIEHNIKMVGIGAEDMVFTVCLLCVAKNYVRVPNVVYFYRKSINSITSSDRNDVTKTIHKWFKMLIDAINYMEEFSKRNAIFSDNSQAKYLFYEAFAFELMHYIIPIYAQIPAHQLDAFLQNELLHLDNSIALRSFLFSRMNILNLQLNQAVNLINQQPRGIQDFQRQQSQLQQQQAIIQQQAAQIQKLQQQLKSAHDIFR